MSDDELLEVVCGAGALLLGLVLLVGVVQNCVGG